MSSPVEIPKPRAGCWLFIIPVLLIVFMVIGYIVLFAAGVMGTTAHGERVTLRYQACAEAVPLLRERVDLMGLGDPVYEADAPGMFGVTVTLPGEPDVDAGVKTLLATPGRFEIRSMEDSNRIVVAGERVSGATMNIPWTGGSVTLIRLDDEGSTALRDYMQQHPDGRIAMSIDGKVLYERSNLPAEARGNLEIEATEGSELEKIRVAVERSILLEAGPLPCEVTAVD